MEKGIKGTGMRLEDCRENFRGKDGKPYLVRCPQCGRENYTANVSLGICTWCGWKADKSLLKEAPNA